MNTSIKIGLVIAMAGAAALLGYGWGRQQQSTTTTAATPTAPAATASQPHPPARKLLYYRNPMGQPDTSPTPKKDSMGMDYIPVYEGEDDAGSPSGTPALRLSTEKIQKLGVRTATVELRNVQRRIRANARIEADERRLFTVSSKFEGYVERLHVNATGQTVKKGQALFDVYSPELVSAQREYAIAVQGQGALAAAGDQAQASMHQLAQSSLNRLRNWDISEAQIQSLAQSGEARRTLSYPSPVSGLVMEKKAVQGMRFMPGEMLYQVADLSNVWVIAEIAEQDLSHVGVGSSASVSFSAYPGKPFSGRVSYIYPTFKAETRTGQLRIELPNPALLLKPGMFAQVEIAATGTRPVLAVPLSAVIDSGTRTVVLAQLEGGRFESREVKLGARNDEYVQVLEGVREGENVVIAANFLIDSESNLRAALGGLAPSGPTGHKAQGTVDHVEAQTLTATISHAPVASLKWPAMTMDFKASNAAVLAMLKPGTRVDFEFVERKPGEWVVTRVTPMPPGTH